MFHTGRVSGMRQGDVGPFEHGVLLQVVQGLQALPRDPRLRGQAQGLEVRRFARARPRGLHAPQGGRRERVLVESSVSPDKE